LGSRLDNIWAYDFDSDTSLTLGFSEAQTAMWAGVSLSAYTAKKMLVRGTQFRTANSEANLSTRDSGVAATFQTDSGHNKVVFGILERILRVNALGQEKILLVVNWFRESESNPTCFGTWWVKTSGKDTFMKPADSIIEASKIDHQVFFCEDPCRPGWSHVFAYRGSSYQIPGHHYGPDGRVLDLEHMRPT
jgi:hypothetical protein